MPVQAALAYLAAARSKPSAVTVLFGDESFLKRQVILRCRAQVLGDDDGAFSLAEFKADAAWRDVHDELSTVALFGAGQRLVVVDDADEFVTAFRNDLEKYVERPRSTGVLLLAVRSFPKNTRLYKLVDSHGLAVDCGTPAEAALRKWLTDWAEAHYQRKMESGAAELLLELIGGEMGLLDQELAKLASYAGEGRPISADMVRELVVTWRTKTTWEMIDATLDGHAALALEQLDRLLTAGEAPQMLLGAFGYRLRQFASATRLIEQAESSRRKLSLRDALVAAGAKPFSLRTAEPQLRQVGRRRALQLFRMLLDADLALKGDSRLEPSVVLERLIVQLSKTAANAATSGR